MNYGDGGASKTTLAIDLGSHIAGGDDWLGIESRSRAAPGRGRGGMTAVRRKLRNKPSGRWRCLRG
jgi:hypothetical protein